VTGDLWSPYPPDGLRHCALLYDDEAGYLDGILGAVRTARAAAEPVMVTVPAQRMTLVRSALPADDGVVLADMSSMGRNPAAIIPATLSTFVSRHPGRVTIVGESLWPGRAPATYPRCVEHEAISTSPSPGTS
jgi:hypothetical protein